MKGIRASALLSWDTNLGRNEPCVSGEIHVGSTEDLVNTQHQLARHVREPAWKQPLLPRSSLQMAAAPALLQDYTRAHEPEPHS